MFKSQKTPINPGVLKIRISAEFEALKKKLAKPLNMVFCFHFILIIAMSLTYFRVREAILGVFPHFLGAPVYFLL